MSEHLKTVMEKSRCLVVIFHNIHPSHCTTHAARAGDVCNLAAPLHTNSTQIAKRNNGQNVTRISKEDSMPERCTENTGTVPTLQGSYSNPISHPAGMVVHVIHKTLQRDQNVQH
jgi:hypothetical protein